MTMNKMAYNLCPCVKPENFTELCFAFYLDFVQSFVE